MLPSDSHRRLRFSLGKGASASGLRGSEAICLLEDVTTRLHDVLAEEFEYHRAQAFGGTQKAAAPQK